MGHMKYPIWYVIRCWFSYHPIGVMVRKSLVPVILQVRRVLLQLNLITFFTGVQFFREYGILSNYPPYDEHDSDPKYRVCGSEEYRVQRERTPLLDSFVAECTDLEEYYERTGH